MQSENRFNSDYNGWSNRATWNVALWLSNDPLYYEKIRGLEIHPRAFQGLCWGLWPAGATPDGDNLKDVNWYELAWSMDEE
jgi:hypothetical protein